MNTRQCQYCRGVYSKYEMKAYDNGPYSFIYLCKAVNKCIQIHNNKFKDNPITFGSHEQILYEAACEIRKPRILKDKLNALIENAKIPTTNN